MAKLNNTVKGKFKNMRFESILNALTLWYDSGTDKNKLIKHYPMTSIQDVLDWFDLTISEVKQEGGKKIDYLKEANDFEKEVTSGLGFGNIQGMGNVHLFAQKLEALKNKSR